MHACVSVYIWSYILYKRATRLIYMYNVYIVYTTHWWSHFYEEQTEWMEQSIWYVDSNKIRGENILMKWLWNGMLFARSIVRSFACSSRQSFEWPRGFSLLSLLLFIYTWLEEAEKRGAVEDRTHSMCSEWAIDAKEWEQREWERDENSDRHIVHSHSMAFTVYMEIDIDIK